MAEHEQSQQKQTIIVRKIKKVHAKHHGGSWKIAYADFVTAMMAFFLLMWLLSMLNKYQLQGIAEYFRTPLKEVFTKQDEIKKEGMLDPNPKGPSPEKNTGGKDLSKVPATEGTHKVERVAPLGKVKTISEMDSDKAKREEDSKKEKAQDKAQNKAQTEKEQIKELTALQKELEAKLEANPELAQMKNSLNFVVTAEGLKITMHDLENKPMFSEGKTDFQTYAQKILNWLSEEINQYPNKMIIIGHTDSVPYSAQSRYSNWELSADRANATRRLLLENGMADDKILRVIGMSDKVLLNKEDSEDPANRRVEIILLTDKAAERIENQ